MLIIKNLKKEDKIHIKFINDKEEDIDVIFDTLGENLGKRTLEVSDKQNNNHISLPIGNIDLENSSIIE